MTSDYVLTFGAVRSPSVSYDFYSKEAGDSFNIQAIICSPIKWKGTIDLGPSRISPEKFLARLFQRSEKILCTTNFPASPPFEYRCILFECLCGTVLRHAIYSFINWEELMFVSWIESLKSKFFLVK